VDEDHSERDKAERFGRQESREHEKAADLKRTDGNLASADEDNAPLCALSNLVPAQLRLVDAHGRSTSASISRIPYL
jgi:hypothetical protein